MNQYRMIAWNTCARCERAIKAGEPVYAENENQVVAGGGLCSRCAHPQPEIGEEVVPSLAGGEEKPAGVSKVVKKSKQRTVSTETVEGL